MPASYVIDKQRRLVITTATGIVTYEECKQHQDDQALHWLNAGSDHTSE